MKQTFLYIFFFFVTTVTITNLVKGHGLLTKPSSKNGGTLSIPHTTSTDHFALASYGIIDKAFFDNDHSKTPWTRPGEFNYEMARDLIPGHPQTLHPCGCNAGDVEHCAGVTVAEGFGETTVGTTLTPPEWIKGSTQETAWNAWVNHAGGYIYMLCKRSEFDSCHDTFLLPKSSADKDAYLQCVWDCFESQTLDYVPNVQKLQFQDDVCSYATMTPQNKFGKNNHVWRSTPIPDSLQISNGGEGVCMWDSVIDFSNDKARDEFIASFGTDDVCDWGRDAHAPSDWHVIDEIQIPTNLDEGEYLLSWRWDAYMADQMWTNCADIEIVSSPSSTTTPVWKKEEECTPMPTSPPMESTPTPAPSINDLLPQDSICPSGYTGLFPFESCTKYFSCINGEVKGDSVDCPDGTLFDINFQYCNWENDVICEIYEPQGCYSNNYRDCNHADFQMDHHSCNTIWLPNGRRNSCVALWGECSLEQQQPNSQCCQPAVCHGDTTYAQCVPPEPQCIVCTDEANPHMQAKGKDCENSPLLLKRKCNTKKNWRENKWCQLSCFHLNLGYDGDICCSTEST